jgi:1-aminocyclopropane-1-carboxylate deaminase/D-cysteine desulfhydrase-like pyridoxal-dependent ACC family enzyme
VQNFSSRSNPSDHSNNYSGPNLQELLSNRKWMLPDPSAELTEIHTPEGANFRILRDDLSHPFIGGNKRRKLDALFPQLIGQGVEDVITCGGTQSAHLLAVAAAAAENGMRAHLLIRGEPPAVSTGNHLFATMFAHSIVYIKRSEYADRSTMLSKYAESLLNENKTSRSKETIAIIPEGGSDAPALLGMLRLINWLHTSGTVNNTNRKCTLIVDSGTGTSAVGLALGIVLANLPNWHVQGVYLAAPIEYYQQQTIDLVHSFCVKERIPNENTIIKAVEGRLSWIPRDKPRKFGNIEKNEVVKCREIGSRYGVLVDPIYTLAAWEATVNTSSKGSNSDENVSDVIMVHTGGVMGSLCGIAQRWPEEF